MSDLCLTPLLELAFALYRRRETTCVTSVGRFTRSVAARDRKAEAGAATISSNPKISRYQQAIALKGRVRIARTIRALNRPPVTMIRYSTMKLTAIPEIMMSINVSIGTVYFVNPIAGSEPYNSIEYGVLIGRLL